MVDEDVLNDIAFAQRMIASTDSSLVVIQYNKIWKQKKGEGIKTLIEVIDEMGNKIKDTIIGINFLDKSSALLCRYAKVKGVHAPKGTKTGIALLIIGGVTSQVNELIQVKNEDLSSFDKLLDDIESPEEAYKILKKAIK